MSKVVPVIVTLSGKLDVDVPEGMTIDQMKNHAMKVWGISPEEVHQSFVVLSDMAVNMNQVCDDDCNVEPLLKRTSVLRVVLPLKPKDMEEPDVAMTLVE